MQKELQYAVQKQPDKGTFISRWGNVHLLCLRTVNSDWREYVNYLDEEVSKIVSRHVLWCLGGC